jgi:hypothetical protein
VDRAYRRITSSIEDHWNSLCYHRHRPATDGWWASAGATKVVGPLAAVATGAFDALHRGEIGVDLRLGTRGAETPVTDHGGHGPNAARLAVEADKDPAFSSSGGGLLGLQRRLHFGPKHPDPFGGPLHQVIVEQLVEERRKSVSPPSVQGHFAGGAGTVNDWSDAGG